MNWSVLAGIAFACTLTAQPNPGAGSVEGHIINSLTGAPIRKASVTLTAGGVWLVAETDAEGRFQFFALPAGTYKLSANRPGFLDRAARRSIVLTSGAVISDAEIRLPPQGILSGHVLDEDADPVGNANVQLFKQTYRNEEKKWEVSGGARTDETGEFRFPNLRPGLYLVRAQGGRPPVNNRYPGRGPQASETYYVPVYYPKATTERAASPVEVSAGMEIRGIDIHLFKVARPPTVHVSGKLVGLPRDSNTITASVCLTSPDGSVPGGYSAMTRATDYTFEISVPPGEYNAFAYVYSGGPEAFATRSLTVGGDLTGVVLTLSPPHELPARISVAEDDRANLAGIRAVFLRHPVFSGNVPQSISDASGKLAFPAIPPGHYPINVDHLPSCCFVQELRLGGHEISANDFEVLASAPLELILSNTAGAIAGAVSDAAGKPFPGSAVTLIPSDAKSHPVKQIADDDGNFKFTNLPPGKYRLWAWEEVDDDQWQDPAFRKKYEGQATEVAVGPSQTENAKLQVIVTEAIK